MGSLQFRLSQKPSVIGGTYFFRRPKLETCVPETGNTQVRNLRPGNSKDPSWKLPSKRFLFPTKPKKNPEIYTMGFGFLTFMEFDAEVLEYLRNMPGLKGKVYHVFATNYWRAPEEGFIYLAIDAMVLPADHWSYEDRPREILVEEVAAREILEPEDIQKAGCGVDYLPDPDIWRFLKVTAEQYAIRVAMQMLHERGDNLYDAWGWMYDPLEEAESEERFYATYEGARGYPVWEIWGHPFFVRHQPGGSKLYTPADPVDRLKHDLGFSFPDPIEILYSSVGYENKRQTALKAFLVN